MDKIKIITDSTCDLPKSIVEKYDIEVLPLIVNLGDKSYYDRVEINFDELMLKIQQGEGFPTTSQINPQRFYDCYKKYLQQGYKIISIHLSSKMSGTFQSASIAKDMLENENIRLIDSTLVTSALGILVLKAALLKEKGKNINEIENTLRECIPHVKSTISFTELDHLVKGGRLSKTAGMIGNILGIKPMLTLKDGEIIVSEKVRGNKKALKYMMEFIESTGYDPEEPFMLLNAQGEGVIEPLREGLKEKGIDFIECEVGCVVGTHSGPKACAVFFLEKF